MLICVMTPAGAQKLPQLGICNSCRQGSTNSIGSSVSISAFAQPEAAI